MIVVLLFALVPFAFAASALHRAFGPVAASDVSAVISNGCLDDTPSVRLLIERSLSRARRFRTTTSVIAWAGMLAIVVARNISGAHAFGVSVGSLYVAGISGYLCGAILGETHHVRRPRPAVRVASASPRSVGAYRTGYLHNMMLAGTLLAVAVTGLAIIEAHISKGRDLQMAMLACIAVTAIAVATVVNLMQHRVAWRRRPALPEALACADDLLRKGAFATLDAAGGGLAWMLTSIAAARYASTVTAPNFGAAAWLGSLVAACLAVGLALDGRRVAWPRPASRSTAPLRHAGRT